MKNALVHGTAVVMLFLASCFSHAADEAGWPVRPIRIIAPDAPGAGNDVFIRLMAPHFAQILGVPVFIENKPGAGGRIGVEAAFRAAPDGYTLLVGNAGSNGINGAIYKNLPYDLERDFVPISLLVTGPNVLIVNRKLLPVEDVQGLLEVMRKRPGQINFAITAPGASGHMMTEMFRMRTRLDLVTVPYRGAPDMTRALLAGEVHANFNNLVNVMPQVRSGEFKVLAVTSSSQTSFLPGVRTMMEQGVPDFDTIAWTALFAPRGTPKVALEKIQMAVSALRTNRDLAERILAQGGQLTLSDSDALRQKVSSDIARWKSVAAAAKMSVD